MRPAPCIVRPPSNAAVRARMRSTAKHLARANTTTQYDAKETDRGVAMTAGLQTGIPDCKQPKKRCAQGSEGTPSDPRDPAIRQAHWTGQPKGHWAWLALKSHSMQCAKTDTHARKIINKQVAAALWKPPKQQPQGRDKCQKGVHVVMQAFVSGCCLQYSAQQLQQYTPRQQQALTAMITKGLVGVGFVAHQTGRANMPLHCAWQPT